MLQVSDLKKMTQEGMAAQRQNKFNNQLKKQLTLFGLDDNLAKAKKAAEKELSSIQMMRIQQSIESSIGGIMTASDPRTPVVGKTTMSLIKGKSGDNTMRKKPV